MERLKLRKPIIRAKLEKKPDPWLAGITSRGPIDPRDDAAWEGYTGDRIVTGDKKRIAELEHEIRTIQGSARDVIRRAEREAANVAEAATKRKYDKQLVEIDLDNRNLRLQNERLKQAMQNNLAPGTQYACPHCGTVTDGPDEDDEDEEPARRAAHHHHMH